MYHWLINIEFTKSNTYSSKAPAFLLLNAKKRFLTHWGGHFQEHKEQARESPKTSQKRQCHLVPCYDWGCHCTPSDHRSPTLLSWGLSDTLSEESVSVFESSSLKMRIERS